VLSLVGELLSGDGCGSSNRTQCSLFVYVFICIWHIVYAYPVKRTESCSTKRKENNRRFPPEIITFVFGDHDIYTTSLVPLCYSTAGVSLPIPLSAANLLSRSTISIHRFPEVKLAMKFKTDGPELPATDAINSSLCCTNNVRLTSQCFHCIWNVQVITMTSQD
jgi:hypothetical protein